MDKVVVNSYEDFEKLLGTDKWNFRLCGSVARPN